MGSTARCHRRSAVDCVQEADTFLNNRGVPLSNTGRRPLSGIRHSDADPLSYWNEPVLAQTEAKCQHYVPQCYLQLFGDDRGQVRVVNVDSPSESFRTSIANAAVESHFYDFQVDGQIASTDPKVSRPCREASASASRDEPWLPFGGRI